MNATLPTSEVLNRAADLIEERGWAKGGGWFPEADEHSPVCAEGAIRLAVGDHHLRKQSVTAVLGHYLLDAYPLAQRSLIHGGVMVFAWNDDLERTASEVVEVLRACAVIEASRERETAEAVV